MSKKDVITNWVEKIPKIKKSYVDKTYSNHMIKNNAMILSVGQTGSGKTNGVVEYLSRTDGKWFEIIVYTGSNKKEPLYDFLESKITGIKLIDNPSELPKIEDYKESDLFDYPKLIVFDDSIYEDAKNLKVIERWFMCARKMNFTCMFLSQNYCSTPVFIRRNAHYIQLFKVTDMRDMQNILSKFCSDVDLIQLKKMLLYATENKGDFLTIAVNDPTETKFRKNFLQILNPNDFN